MPIRNINKSRSSPNPLQIQTHKLQQYFVGEPKIVYNIN